MSTEQAQDTQDTQDTQADDVSSETNDNAVVEQPKSDKPPGYYPVDLDDVPEEKAKAIKERYDYFYRQHKEMERKDKARENALREYREIAAEQAKQLDDLRNATGQIVDHLETKTIGETESTIKKEMREAFETGDTEKYIDAQTRLIQLETKKANLAKKNAKQPQKTETQRQAYGGYNSADQLAVAAQADGEITPQQLATVNTWQDETDQTGAPLRPWAKNNSDDPEMPDPDFIKANLVALRVFKNHPDRSIEENLMEVDKIMGTKKPAGKQTVMGGGFTTPQKTNKISLTPEMQKLAVRTKFGARDGAKTDAEYIEAYRKQLQTNRQKGVR